MQDQSLHAAVATMDWGFRSIEMLAIKNLITIATWAKNVTKPGADQNKGEHKLPWS